MPASPPSPCAVRLPLRGWRRAGRWLLVAGLLLGLLAGLLWVARAPLLRGWARMWVVDHALAPADALVVYVGGTPVPTLEAARLYHAGVASRVVLLNGRLRPTDRLELTLPAIEARRRLLEAQGVPPAAITVVGRELRGTFAETAALRDWALSNRVTRLRAVTELAHTRRAAWCAGRLLRPAGVAWRVTAVAPREFSAADWWRHEAGLIHFENELVLWLYDRFKY